MCRLPFCHRPRHAIYYSNERQMAAVRQVGDERYYLPKKIAQNYYENLKENYNYQITAYQNLYILQQRLCCHQLLWTLILCDVTKIWRNKREKKKKREKKRKRKKKKKEKRHTKQLCKRRYESTGAPEAGGPLGWIRSSPTPSIFLLFSERKVIKISHFPNKCAIFQKMLY